MSSYGRAHDALWDLFLGYEHNQMGDRTPGLLDDLDLARVQTLIDEVLRVVDPILVRFGREVERSEIQKELREQGWLLELVSADWFEIKGHGWAASFEGVPGLNPRPLKGQRVSIDGKVYEVKGVETFAVSDATGTEFALLVGER